MQNSGNLVVLPLNEWMLPSRRETTKIAARDRTVVTRQVQMAGSRVGSRRGQGLKARRVTVPYLVSFTGRSIGGQS
jgi:hypothetical protein